MAYHGHEVFEAVLQRPKRVDRDLAREGLADGQEAAVRRPSPARFGHRFARREERVPLQGGGRELCVRLNLGRLKRYSQGLCAVKVTEQSRNNIRER